MLNFEFDPEKSKINKEKHGIDFVDAQLLWQSKHKEFVAKSKFENRFALIGLINKKFYTCIFCLRGEIISKGGYVI